MFLSNLNDLAFWHIVLDLQAKIVKIQSHLLISLINLPSTILLHLLCTSNESPAIINFIEIDEDYNIDK